MVGAKNQEAKLKIVGGAISIIQLLPKKHAKNIPTWKPLFQFALWSTIVLILDQRPEQIIVQLYYC